MSAAAALPHDKFDDPNIFTVPFLKRYFKTSTEGERPPYFSKSTSDETKLTATFIYPGTTDIKKMRMSILDASHPTNVLMPSKIMDFPDYRFVMLKHESGPYLTTSMLRTYGFDLPPHIKLVGGGRRRSTRRQRKNRRKSRRHQRR
jgi:hypothetical protein